ncbi:MAG: diaminopimelate decarboxylase [Rhodospirillales bacterium]|nr:diaminopimelate decarboxylase [Rhodospirillales bacterium]MDE0379889.1 diaminopimelate decarboxylase [Rhodospirillales bacterium]
MDAFQYREQDGLRVLHAEGVSLTAVAAEFGTPTYCYANAALVARYQALAQAAPNALVCYAVKANDTLAVIRTFARLGAGADIISGGELRGALRAGMAPDRLVFAGPGKTREEMDLALASGVGQFNVESPAELEALAAAAQARRTRAPVALRVNPDVDAETHDKIATGRRGDKFGIDDADIPALYARAAALDGIEPVGLAVHIGSQLSRLAPFEAAFDRLVALVESLREAGHPVTRLNLGGGLGVRYRDETPPDVGAYGALVERVRQRLGVAVAIEPGRWLVAPAGVLLTRVIAVKQAGERRWAIVDAAMNDLMRPALYDAWHAIEPVAERAPGAATVETDVAGPVCESGDVLGRGRQLPPLGPGDLLAVRDVGAYGSVMASTYNGRPLPAEVMVRGDALSSIRPRQDHEALLARDLVPSWLA